MALASARPFSPPADPAPVLRGLAEDLVDLRFRLCEERGVLPLDFAVLKALVETPDVTSDELATSAHASPAGLLAALDRLHAARLANVRGFSPRALGDSRAGGPSDAVSVPRRQPQDIRPVATDAGRLMVAGIDGTVELTLDAVLETADDPTRMRVGQLLEACRSSVWELGAAPVVEVLEPPG